MSDQQADLPLPASLARRWLTIEAAERQQAYGHSLQLLLSVIGSHESAPVNPN